ncbi:hypothetical protein M426DRAFT_8443 [Hypoxylon sp. CI-4A]|nr:hypothetical protein M426DRAFT_8443 [Hypoxylon sp. CI-4A]
MSAGITDAEDESYDEDRFEEEPGATIISFGKFEGMRLDEIKTTDRLNYLRFARGSTSPNMAAFVELNERWMNWLDEDQNKSPLSTIVWFGKYQGHDVRLLYSRERLWAWYTSTDCYWAPELRDIGRRYLVWRKRHPRRRTFRRTPSKHQNRVGQKLGPWNDGAASDNDEDYDTDGGFVEMDGNETGEDEDCDELEEEPTDDEESEVYDDGEEASTDSEDVTMLDAPESPNTSTPNDATATNDDSDDSLPSVNELIARARTTPRSQKTPRARAGPTTNNTPIQPRECANISDSDDEPLTTPFRKNSSQRYSLRSPSKNNSFLTPIKQPILRSSPMKSQRSSYTVISSDDSDDGDQLIGKSPTKKHRADTSNTAPVDSDDEPLAPKIRALMQTNSYP